MLNEAIKIRIRLQFEGFLTSTVKSLEDLSLRDMNVNPFLITVLRTSAGLVGPRELARWMVLQRVERGMSTSFGSTLKNVAKEFCNADPLPHMTARIERNSHVYNLLITSGPKHNAGATQTIRQHLLETITNEPGSTPVFGMCYGNNDSIDSNTKKYAKDVLQLVGRDFWTFVSDDPDCYRDILQIASVACEYARANTTSLEDVIHRKIDYVSDELTSLYGNGDKDFWACFLGDVY